MSKIQCPNCNSFDTSSKMNGKTGCGCMSLFLSFMALGGGAGAAQVHGGYLGIFPTIGLILLILGVIMLILGYIQKSSQKIEIYECKNCKCEFEVE